MLFTGRNTLKPLAAAILASTTAVSSQLALAELPQTELNALTAIYNGLNGDNWTTNTGWNTDTDPCSGWHGVTCNAAGTHVVELDLERNNARGFLSTTIGDLTELTDLKMAVTRLDGTSIPAEIGNLSKLKSLYITDAFLVGTIPEELGQLSNLEALYLDDNFYLEGEIPASLGNLTALRELRLYNNNLTGNIPESFSNLRLLSDLRLYNNKLTGELPSFIASLPNLEFINLDWNGLYSTDATVNSYIDSRLYESESTSYLDTQTLDAELTTPDLGETSVRLYWTPVDTTPSSHGGYRVFVSDAADGEFTQVKEVPGKDSSSTLVDNLTAETTYFYKVLSYTDDVEIISIKGELQSTGEQYAAQQVTTLAAGSGNDNVDTTPDQEEEEQPDPVAPEDNPDIGTDPETDSDSDSDDSGSSGGGAPLAILFALTALLLGRRIRK